MQSSRLVTTFALAAAISLGAAACDDEDGGENPEEVITTVILTFAPTGGGAAITATFDDPDGDGGQAPTTDPINLANNTAYTLTVQFQNRLESPPEEITDEVRDEQNFHLLLFTGSAVVGPATTNAMGPVTQAYSDTDGNGFPVGLTSSIMAKTGAGQMTVTLRHMPPEEPPVKAADTVAKARSGGVDSIGGSTDVQVTFMVTVP